MVNTYNESSLHKILKTLYCQKENGTLEQPIDNWICDVVCDKNIIEIQTSNLGSLCEKLKCLLSKGYNIKLVATVENSKIIQTKMLDSTLKTRKSPKKNYIYDILSGLCTLSCVLLEKNFCLEVLFINVTQKRIQNTCPTQSKNNTRRFLKTWVNEDKDLDKIVGIKRFYTKKDYALLLPPLLQKENAIFCAKDIKEYLVKQGIEKKPSTKTATKRAYWLIRLLQKLKIIDLCQKEGKIKYYCLNKTPTQQNLFSVQKESVPLQEPKLFSTGTKSFL